MVLLKVKTLVGEIIRPGQFMHRRARQEQISFKTGVPDKVWRPAVLSIIVS